MTDDKRTLWDSVPRIISMPLTRSFTCRAHLEDVLWLDRFAKKHDITLAAVIRLAITCFRTIMDNIERTAQEDAEEKKKHKLRADTVSLIKGDKR